ncbi:hypothetical protein DEO72_LG8g2017 [Vigna unguiculata]|uniref:Uncharacterized protein n=1 Tax=Vigna unguiculata TaxID=3917 RepID=A0A4D6MVQ9_VIGUN|nr:hypothetical protein DEO72_LG8g2017 [Vigna unguiculata]
MMDNSNWGCRGWEVEHRYCDGAWRLEHVRQAIGLALEVPASRSAWRQGGLDRFRLAACRLRQTIMFLSMVHGWWITCDDMSGEVHIQLLSCGDTSEVRRAGLRAGRFVEQDYKQGDCEVFGLSPTSLFVYDDDRVIRYTGADVDTGDVEDAQVTE